ncbi:MAG: hypothetical protein ACKVW3_05255 [Phycisphaerales bacterium]
MPASHSQRWSWAFAAVASMACLALAVFLGGRRISAFYVAADRQTFAFQASTARELQHAGRNVTLIDDTDEAGQGGVAVVLGYGDQSVRIPAGVAPGSDQMPGLVRHRDWLRVLRFVDRKGLSLQEVESALATGTIEARVVVVARRPTLAPDPRTGNAWRRDWSFEFRELMPDGTITSEALLYPRSRPGRATKPGQLAEGTWQWDAAMMLLPSTARPSRSFTTDALYAMGWTFPVGMGAVLSLMVCVTGLGASRITRRRALAAA